MDALLVGSLAAVVTVASMLFWLLLVRPDALLGLLSDQPEGSWFEHHPTTLRALRLTGGLVVLILGFLTGLAVMFLASTA